MHVHFTLSGLLVQVRLLTTCTASPLPINTLPSRYATICEITSKTNEISQVLRVHDKDEQHVVFDEGSEERTALSAGELMPNPFKSALP